MDFHIKPSQVRWWFSCSVILTLFQPHGLLWSPWTLTHQTPLSMGFPRHKYWSGLPFPSPGDHPHPGIKPGVLLGRRILYHWATWEAPCLKMEVVKSISEDSVRSESNVRKISGTCSTQQILADALYFPFLFSSLLQLLYVYFRQAC